MVYMGKHLKIIHTTQDSSSPLAHCQSAWLPEMGGRGGKGEEEEELKEGSGRTTEAVFSLASSRGREGMILLLNLINVSTPKKSLVGDDDVSAIHHFQPSDLHLTYAR